MKKYKKSREWKNIKKQGMKKYKNKVENEKI